MIVSWAWIEAKVFARDTTQDHAFDAVQIVEAIAGGFFDGSDEGFTGIVADHAQQLAQGKNEILPAPLLESQEVIGEFRRCFQDRLLFRMRIGPFDAFPARRTVFGQSDALLLWRSNAAVGHDVAQIELDFDGVFGFADLDSAADPGDRHGVPIRLQRDVSFHVDDPLMNPVYLGNPEGQRLEMCPFDSKQLARNCADMLLVGRIDAIAPLAGLKIEILPTGESASGKEVVLDEVKRSFDASGTIRITELVGSELETEAFAEGLHLGYWNHLTASATQHNDVSVIDQDPTANPSEKTQGVGQEHLAIEALERGVALKEQHPRVAQDGGCRLRRLLLAGDLNPMWRGVMLQLFTWRKIVDSRWQLQCLADAVPAAKRRQRRIGKSQSAANEFLMDPDEIALAVGPLLQDLLPVGFRFLGSVQ